MGSIGRVVDLGLDGCGNSGGRVDPEDLDDRTRFQYKALLQFLQEKELFETLSAFEHEIGFGYSEGEMATAGVLQASLDMFGQSYGGIGAGSRDQDPAGRAAEEALQQLVDGACCTGPCSEGAGPTERFGGNVTAVAWAALSFDELVLVVATADRRIRLLGGPEGAQVLTDFRDLASPPLGLDVGAVVSPEAPDSSCCQDILVTTMGGEVQLLKLRRPPPSAFTASASSCSLESGQRFKDHQKQVTSGRFAPLQEGEVSSRHFVTVSRDHKANFYARPDASSDFCLTGTASFIGEATCCCWLDFSVCALAARDDHELHYWRVGGGNVVPSAPSNPKEELRVNLNALGDSVVSFTVLALAVSPDRSLVAACTDKSRVIVLEALTARQLRNLFGAIVNELDVPSVCFSLDGCFVYVSSSLPHPGREAEEEEPRLGLCGQVAIFQVRDASLVLQLPCHEKAVRCFDRHPRRELLATGSFDKTVKYWG